MEEPQVPTWQSENKYVDHLPSSHYYKAYQLPHNEEGCIVFARTPYVFAPYKSNNSLEYPKDTLNMLSIKKENSKIAAWVFPSFE